MKIIRSFIVIIMSVCMLMACSEFDKSDLELSDNLETNLKSHANVHGKFYVVEPNGVDDTQTLKAAFENALSHGPGAMVQLMEGNYYLSFIEVREFNGVFKGAGKGKTVITALQDLDIAPLVSQDLNTFLIKFVGGDVKMSDMTIQTPNGVLTTNGDEWWLEGLVSFAARNRQYESEKDKIRAVVNNVEFIAGNEPVSGWKSNCNMGLKAGFDSRFSQMAGGWPLSPTDIIIKNCVFDNFDIYGALIAYVSEGIIIAGTQNNGNIFKNNSTAAYGWGGSLSLWHNANILVSAIGNTFVHPQGSRFGIEINSSPWLQWLEDVPQIRETIINIEQNNFDIKGAVGGLLVVDNRRKFYLDERPMLVQVKNNKFNMRDEAFTGIGSVFLSKMVIRNNMFTGSGAYAVRILGFDPTYNENGMMIHNDFSNTNYSVATIFLNEGTRNWTIIGDNLGEKITDNGKNNHIMGMFKYHAVIPFEHPKFDNFDDMRKAMHSMKSKYFHVGR